MAAENGATWISSSLRTPFFGLNQEWRKAFIFPQGSIPKSFSKSLFSINASFTKARADRRLLSPDDLMLGGKSSTSKELVAMMTDPAYKVLSF
jgi:hypothetical protein